MVCIPIIRVNTSSRATLGRRQWTVVQTRHPMPRSTMTAGVVDHESWWSAEWRWPGMPVQVTVKWQLVKVPQLIVTTKWQLHAWCDTVFNYRFWTSQMELPTSISSQSIVGNWTIPPLTENTTVPRGPRARAIENARDAKICTLQSFKAETKHGISRTITSSSLNHIRFSAVSTNQNSAFPPLNMLMLCSASQPLRITFNTPTHIQM